MKKIIALVLVLMMVLGLSACGAKPTAKFVVSDGINDEVLYELKTVLCYPSKNIIAVAHKSFCWSEGKKALLDNLLGKERAERIYYVDYLTYEGARSYADFTENALLKALGISTASPVVSEVKELKEKGYKIYLLSNCPSWFDEFKKSVPAFDFFDGFIISAKYNLIKPGKEIFDVLFNEFSLKAEECFFIDDSPANVTTANEIGMTAHCFSKHEISKLIDALHNADITF